MLARDLNDAITVYNPSAAYTPDRGTTETDENLQLAGVLNINMGDEFKRIGLLKTETPADYVRFAPWGKPARPFFLDEATVVTLTAPWLEGSEVRYTLDGTEPLVNSALYTEPLKISKLNVSQSQITVRAAAFRKGKQVSLPSDAFYVKLPAALPPQPNVYLEDLQYITNAYLQNTREFAWLPERWKSFEGKPLRIRKTTYAHGMGFRAPSSVQYDLKPEYKRFVALAGIDENLLEPNNGRFLAMHSSVVFKAFIDGKLVAESPVMRISQAPWRFDFAIPAGSRRLSIVCMNGGKRSLLDYGNWVNAGFVTE
jgi:hypothetical protein